MTRDYRPKASPAGAVRLAVAGRVSQQRVTQDGTGADITGMLGRNHVIVISTVLGVALELGIHAMSGRRESWDSERAFLWTLAVVPAQVLTMMARSGDLDFSLWPLTVAFSAILSFPFVIAASIGAALRRRVRPEAAR